MRRRCSPPPAPTCATSPTSTCRGRPARRRRRSASASWGWPRRQPARWWWRCGRWTAPATRRVLLAEAAPSEGFVHLDVTALTPGAIHRYAFFEQVGDALREPHAPSGASAPRPPPTRWCRSCFGAVSCTANGRSHAARSSARAGAATSICSACSATPPTTTAPTSRSRLPQPLGARTCRPPATAALRAGTQPAGHLGRPRGDQQLEPRDHRASAVATGDAPPSSSTCPSAATRRRPNRV